MDASQSSKLAPPLIALPGTSPRIATGRRGWRSLGAILAMLAIGETGDESTPLPVTIRGDAGRQVRGSASARKGVTGGFKPEAIALHKNYTRLRKISSDPPRCLHFGRRYRRHATARKNPLVPAPPQ
ncbi:hypothetical protein BQ8794_40375 [Mesorhizobium prunaredense]|uniref:Uncharacterized protein n=1 Tax=Mesorhizobium prunaredense TaxID=1631249 RepID=A0A1R3VD22_9HYPH|nr:hypothetical protein BQ8794_40375 [Mesorhizobium prunaredense]